MSDNAPAQDERYVLPVLRHPQGIDGESHEALDTALEEYELHLFALLGYAQRVEDLTRSAMLSEAVTLPEDMLPRGGSTGYPDATYELQAVTRANKALTVALDMIMRARAELAKPVTESRRVVDS